MHHHYFFNNCRQNSYFFVNDGFFLPPPGNMNHRSWMCHHNNNNNVFFLLSVLSLSCINGSICTKNLTVSVASQQSLHYLIWSLFLNSSWAFILLFCVLGSSWAWFHTDVPGKRWGHSSLLWATSSTVGCLMMMSLRPYTDVRIYLDARGANTVERLQTHPWTSFCFLFLIYWLYGVDSCSSVMSSVFVQHADGLPFILSWGIFFLF